MVDFSEGNLRRLVRALESLGYRPRVPVRLEDFVSAENRQRWQKEKGMVVFSVTRGDSDPLTIDIMIDPPVDFDRAYRRRSVLRADTLRLSVLSIEDLITLKRFASRDQDLADVQALEDVRYLRRRMRMTKK